MSLFEKQINQYKEKFNQLYATLGKKDVIALYNKCGITDVEAELKGNTVAFKSLSMVAAAAFMVTATNVNTCCWYYFGQDELPEEAGKLRRF